MVETKPWVFDASVAAAFDHIARTQIPNYEIVIERCVALARKLFPHNVSARIIDVGSARGYMVARLVEAGFVHTLGVDSSSHMVATSASPERIIHSDVFPAARGPFDMVIANWTLHFIKAREDYIRSIFNGLNPGGVFVLSERMEGSQTSYQLYLDYKRSKGVSEDDIMKKEKALVGVLEPLPLQWYFGVLEKVGFEKIEIIDAVWCFNTLLCRKPLT